MTCRNCGFPIYSFSLKQSGERKKNKGDSWLIYPSTEGACDDAPHPKNSLSHPLSSRSFKRKYNGSKEEMFFLVVLFFSLSSPCSWYSATEVLDVFPNLVHHELLLASVHPGHGFCPGLWLRQRQLNRVTHANLVRHDDGS